MENANDHTFKSIRLTDLNQPDVIAVWFNAWQFERAGGKGKGEREKGKAPLSLRQY